MAGFGLSAVDVAIAMAVESGTLRIVTGTTRTGDAAWFISDDHGLLAVALSAEEADAIVAGRWS